MSKTTKIDEIHTNCFLLEQLLLYADKSLSEDKASQLESHIEICDLCADAVAGFKKANDKNAIRTAIADINKKIQQKAGVEENEVIIKTDYRIGIAIGIGAVVLIGLFCGVRYLLSTNDNASQNLNQVNSQTIGDSSTMVINQEDTIAKVDSLQHTDSLLHTMATATGSSGMPLTASSDSTGAVNQSVQITTNAPTGAIPITEVHGPRKSPKFQGGDTQTIGYINANKRYPQEAKEKNIHGFVKIAFTLDENGKVIKTRIIKGIGGGCDEEASRLFMSMPNWFPANDGTKNIGGEYVWDVEF